ncbi:MAG: CDP-alcohol phosphatidyltransferase family protein [Granulosicoccus sp.]|nr:CDP-alcohol phosphatidyltransferase family protein [Granulosicoccus sp.]
MNEQLPESNTGPDSEPDAPHEVVSGTGRRPLASRSTLWARRLCQLLATTPVTPNQISLFSVVFAILALLSMVVAVQVDTALSGSIWLMAAALACQMRLLCNLMDGMVAIEAGKQSRDGAVWNELPDRAADVIILAGLGFAAGVSWLGWAVAALAVSTAYVRELGKGIDGVVDFSGPMAKPHRMALVTGALLTAAFFNLVVHGTPMLVPQVLEAALWLLCAGCLITLYRRSRHLLLRLRQQ